MHFLGENLAASIATPYTTSNLITKKSARIPLVILGQQSFSSPTELILDQIVPSIFRVQNTFYSKSKLTNLMVHTLKEKAVWNSEKGNKFGINQVTLDLNPTRRTRKSYLTFLISFCSIIQRYHNNTLTRL